MSEELEPIDRWSRAYKIPNEENQCSLCDKIQKEMCLVMVNEDGELEMQEYFYILCCDCYDKSFF
jgi:hypothetical protein